MKTSPAFLTYLAIILMAMPGYASKQLNVLMIAIDDLRPELGCYNKTEVISPNIDKLAAQGLLFERAYCQIAVCNPSRASLMTGRRPDTTGVYDLETHFRKALPDVVTLPQHFKNNGYHTLSFGKIYHGAFSFRSAMNDKQSWSVPAWFPTPRYYYTEEGSRKTREVYAKRKKGKKVHPDAWTNDFVTSLSCEAPEVDDNVLQDGQIASKGIEALQQLAQKKQPFFLAVGFLKPHLPFIAPKKYWDMYKRDEIKLADNSFAPKGMPAFAGNSGSEIRNMYTDVPRKGPFSEDLERELIHGYRACVSYLDAQIGRVIDELDRLDLRENTVIVLWGDHGWKLGEHGMWGKQTNFELDARAPLIVSAPGFPKGIRTSALCEFVDIYPGISELCGLPLPDGLEGTSFAPLLQKPDTPWKKTAFSQYPRGSKMGYSMRTDRWRYTRWINRKTGKQVAIELYDHKLDPCENVNVAKVPENKEVIKQLSSMMKNACRME